MSATDLPLADPMAPKKPHKFEPISDETVACIEGLTDTAFWQLMLGDDLDVCERDVDLLCANLRYRLAQVRISYSERVPW
jgi:hypothetical protein